MRYYAQDVRDKVIELLQDSSSGFDAKISDINTTRGHTAPAARSIGYAWGQNQTPFIIVDIDETEVVYDDADITLDLENLPVTHTLMVMGVLKYADDQVYNWAEDWIEAIVKVLHNYNDNNISWLAWTNTDRAEMYGKTNEVFKTFAVTFECRID